MFGQTNVQQILKTSEWNIMRFKWIKGVWFYTLSNQSDKYALEMKNRKKAACMSLRRSSAGFGSPTIDCTS